MTEAKEVKPSVGDVSLSVNNDSVSMTTAETVREKGTENMEDAEKKEDREEEEELEEEEEEEDDEEEEEEVDEEGEEEEEVEDDSDEETEESDEDTEDEIENKLEPGPVDVSIDGGKVMNVEVSLEKNPDRIVDSPIHGVENGIKVHSDDVMPHKDDGGVPVSEASAKSDMATNQKSAISTEKDCLRHDVEEDHDVKSDSCDSFKDRRFDNENVSRNHFNSLKVEHTKEEMKNGANKKDVSTGVAVGNPSKSFIFDTDTSGGGESGTEDEQTEFMMELDKFHKERSLDFKPPKFYGEPLNLLKLWRSVLKLGGYDKVTACKFWRQVGESFKPPKTCTTVSWTFRIFYEKALLDYERHRTSSDGSNIPGSLAVPMGAENQAAGSRARRDAAARCMQGWHSQRILDNGEVSDPIIKDKNSNSLNKKEKQLKNLGVLKRKNSNSTDQAVRPVRAKVPKSQTETTVIDIGSPADWVKINVRETKDCYEVYALVPGLLREEVRVQSDPAGRLVISGEPENPDNPWSVTPFKKVVSLPSRIDPHQTSAVVTLHGQLFVRVPFEQYD